MPGESRARIEMSVSIIHRQALLVAAEAAIIGDEGLRVDMENLAAWLLGVQRQLLRGRGFAPRLPPAL